MTSTQEVKRRRLEEKEPSSSSSSDEAEWQSELEDDRPFGTSKNDSSVTEPRKLNLNRDSSSEESSVNQDDHSKSVSIARLSPDLLRLIFSFATHVQLAHQLPLVSQKWYRIVCYSDSLWVFQTKKILQLEKQAPSTGNSGGETRSVFQQQTKSSIPSRKHHPYNALVTTTDVGRKRSNQKPSSLARGNFIFAYRRHILCELFFQEMELDEFPVTDTNARAALHQFQQESKIKLPLGLFHLLQRAKIHRYIPHLRYANLDLQKLEYISLPSNRILLHWLKDCQDCWSGFILFDKDNPTPDPPVYSETAGVNFTFGFIEFLRKYNANGEKGNETDAAAKLLDAETVESQLCLENSRLSIFLENFAVEAKHWDMDDANSSLQEEAENDLLRQEEEKGTSSDSNDDIDKPRRPKRLNAIKHSLSDSDGGEAQYEDFGLSCQPQRMVTTNANQRRSSSSSSEAEWQNENL